MKRSTLVMIPMLAALAACSSNENQAETAEAPTFHEVMKDKVDLRADEVWAIGNAAIHPGVKISDEGIVGGHTAAQVQSGIDKDPQALRDMAQTLAVHMDDLAKAARERDIDRAALLINQLDSVCESCHLEFWYPDQKELVEQYLDQPS